MVSELPPKLPRNLKGVRTKNPGKTKGEQKPEVPLPANIFLAPKKEELGARVVPAKQGARNRFEKALKAEGLPVAAIARNQTGKQISAQWRLVGSQEKLAKLLKQGYNQVAKLGYMKEQTKERIVDLMQKTFGVAKSNPMWNNILRQLYGVSSKK